MAQTPVKKCVNDLDQHKQVTLILHESSSKLICYLCFSVNLTIMGDSSYKTNTPGSPWSPIRPLATFSCLVTENWFVFNTWKKAFLADLRRCHDEKGSKE